MSLPFGASAQGAGEAPAAPPANGESSEVPGEAPQPDQPAAEGAPSTAAPPAIEVRPGTGPVVPASEAAKEGAEIVAGPPQLLPGWADRRVPIVLVPSDANVSLRIRPLGDVQGEKPCAASCVANVRPGRYEVSVFKNGEDTGSRKFELTYPERLTFTPPDEKAHRTGLILGIAGSVVFEAGVILTVVAYSASLSECTGSGCDEGAGWLGPVGIGTMLAGGVAAPIGWVMFANNANPTVERAPIDPVTLKPPTAGKTEAPRVTARIQPLGDGLMLGGRASF